MTSQNIAADIPVSATPGNSDSGIERDLATRISEIYVVCNELKKGIANCGCSGPIETL